MADDDGDDSSYDFIEEENIGWVGAPSTFADCYLTQEELREFCTPTLDKWEDLLVSEYPLSTIFKIDSAGDEAWKSAKEELVHVTRSVLRMLKINDASDVSVASIVGLFFGKSTEFTKIIMEATETDDYEIFLQFLTTLCAQAAYRVTTREMYDEHSVFGDLVDGEELMQKTHYVAMWEKIARSKKVALEGEGYICYGRRDTCNWERMERAFNDVCRSLFVANRVGSIKIALDDDKVWFMNTGANAKDRFGLKYCTHVRDNRKGLICHTAVSSSLNLPLGISFEKTDDTTASCFKKILINLFPGGPNGLPDLRNVLIFSDRGYLIPSLVWDFILAAGADIVGTVKRAPSWPFNFSMTDTNNEKRSKNPKSDKRQLISVKGAAALFVKTTRKSVKTLGAFAFRNGSGTVSTAISSIHRFHQWDGVPLYRHEHEEYKLDPDRLKDKALYFLPQSTFVNKDQMDPLITNLLKNVDPITLRQGTADWHWGRKFSLTSSHSHEAFEAAFSLFKNKCHWKIVAEYLHGPTWSSIYKSEDEGVEYETDNDANDLEIAEDQGLIDEDDCLDERDVVEKQFFSYFIDLRENTSDARTLIILDDIISMIERNDNILSKDKEYDKDYLITFLKIVYNRFPSNIRGRLPTSQKSISERVNKFRIKGNAARMLMGLSNGFLEDKVIAFNLHLTKTKSADNMIDLLVSSNNVHRALSLCRLSLETNQSIILPALTANNPTTFLKSSESQDITRRKTIKAILLKSFMPRLTGERREYCSLGHQLELPVFMSFMRDMNENQKLAITVGGAYAAGLVAKKDRLYAKDSIDFLAGVQCNGQENHEIWGVEIKARVTIKTMQEEEDWMVKTGRRHSYLRVRDSKVYKNVPKVDERFQLLHHAYVWGLRTIMLLVGDRQSNVIQGTVVDYDEGLIAAYDKVLFDIYELSLKWIYNSGDDDIESSIGPLVATDLANELIATINGVETLSGAVSLWKEIFLNPLIPLPLPSLHRIIPAPHAYWNSVKSGSDTCTKLIDSCPLIVPHCNCETRATGRIIMLCFVVIHRLRQIFSSGDTDIQYGYLERYRNAAAQRISFHDTLLVCMDTLRRSRRRLSKGSTISTSSSLTFDDTSGRNFRPRREKVMGKIPEVLNPFLDDIRTSKTPKKMMKQQIEEGIADEDIVHRWNNCYGRPAQVIKNKLTGELKTMSCCICKEHRTSWYCFGCHGWFCMNNKMKDKGTQVARVITDIEGDEYFIKSCYYEKHCKTWELMM